MTNVKLQEGMKDVEKMNNIIADVQSRMDIIDMCYKYRIREAHLYNIKPIREAILEIKKEDKEKKMKEVEDLYKTGIMMKEIVAKTGTTEVTLRKMIKTLKELKRI